MWKKKPFRCVPVATGYYEPPRGAVTHGFPGDGWYHGYRHEISGRKAWLSTREMDVIDSRDWLVYCSLRSRDRRKLPDPWDDLGHSRGYYIKSWKDKTRKKRQWE